MKTACEILEAAAARVEACGLSQGILARDKDGLCVDFDAPDAASWCALGAILKESRGDHQSRLVAVGMLKAAVPGGNVIDWNDRPGRKAGEVAALLREVARG